MHIAIGSDHVGLELKPVINEYLKELGHKVKDFGTFTDERVDYPDYSKKSSRSSTFWRV
jgi:ribose 5-phosphate isomerase B